MPITLTTSQQAALAQSTVEPRVVIEFHTQHGTYYLAVSGGNVTWAFAPSLPGLAGVLGPVWMSDPTINSRWQPVSGPHAMEIDGTAIAPEPSSWLLVGTGIFGLAGSVRRRIRHV